MSFVDKWYAFGRSQTFDAGIRFQEKGSYIEAIEQFRTCLKQEREVLIRKQASRHLAGCLGRVGESCLVDENFPAAAKFFEEALAIEPTFADLWLKLSNAYFGLCDRGKEKKAVEEALRLNPKYAQAKLKMAIIHYEEGDREASLKQVKDTAFDLKSVASEIFDEILYYHREGNFSEAAFRMRQLKPKHPTDAQSLLIIGDQMARASKWEDAEVHFAKAAMYEPRWADVRCRLGQALMELGRLKEAVSEFDAALDINPGYAEAASLKGIAYRRMGQEDEAIQSFRAALEIDPNHPIALEEILRRV